jgi:hypothetical protein
MSEEKRVRTAQDVLTWSTVLKWIPMLILFAGLLTQWVTMSLQIQQTRSDSARVEQSLQTADDKMQVLFDTHVRNNAVTDDVHATQYLAIQVKLAEIQKDLLYIRSELDKTK